MLETEASREKWSVRFALIAVVISLGALLVTFLQWRSSDRAVQVAEHARQDAVTEAARQRIDAENTLEQQRKDAAVALEAQTKRADRANTLADRSAKAAQQSANAATAQLETTDRPWIKAVPQAWSPITFRENGALSFNVTFALTNVGRSVATDVTIYPGAFVPTWGAAHFTQPLERQTELCRKVQPYGVRIALFPNETKQLNVGVTISREEIEANVVPPPPGMTNPPIPPGRRVDPIFFGCVDYRFASLPRHHQTGFIYDIVRIDPQTPNVPYLIIVGQDLPAADVTLERWAFGGDYAN
jgi:hypothetical protein